ncbi:MAG: hypothetical protein KA144_05205 [Xanthomonadaceae bacterium]|nr:hypothetical protein [Xanthomonadaceae bacterium]
MSRTPLYRSEVLDAKRNRWLGRLVLRQPMSHWAMTGGAIAIVTLLTVFLFVGEYARKVRISGRLVEIAASPRAANERLIAQGPAQGSTQRAPLLEAELLIPEHALASVDVGAEVFLRYSAYPHQRYGQYRGRILRISRIPIADESPASTQALDEIPGAQASRYRAVVSLERQRVRDDRGVERDLRPGLGVMADIVVEKRALYRWLFEPLARS